MTCIEERTSSASTNFIEVASVHIYSTRTVGAIIPTVLPSIPRTTNDQPTLPPFSLSLISPRGAFIVVSSHNTRTVIRRDASAADAFPALSLRVGLYLRNVPGKYFDETSRPNGNITFEIAPRRRV